MLENVSIDALKVSKTFPQNSRPATNICIDCGSTGTRGLLFSRGESDFSKVDVETSEYACKPYDYDSSHIRMLRPMLRDCLEVKLNPLKEGKQPFTFFKGSLANQIGVSNRAMASVSKADQEATTVNIHSMIVMSLLRQIIATNCDIPETTIVRIRLSLALPPEDMNSHRIDSIKKDISGQYEAYLPRLSRHFTYYIPENDIQIVSECNATAMYYGLGLDEDLSDMNIIIIEGGGRSSSAAVVKNGQLIQELNMNSLDVSGFRLRSELITLISQNKGMSTISDAMADKAIMTGFIRNGAKLIDITRELFTAKEIVASGYIDFIYKTASAAGIKVSEVQRVVYSGRLFLPILDTEKSTIISPSIADMVMSKINKDVFIESNILCDRYPIPMGLGMYRVSTDD